ncbi:MAG TPA: hypothetical protein VMC09_12050 [Anaerolineales bacterium]|nr:hypothetical protein [Anaerolineales bacterium]
MDPRNKFWLSIIVFVTALVVIACSCGGLTGSGSSPNSSPKPEPIPGLTGKWQAPKFGVTFTFTWDGANYQVSTTGMDSGASYPVSSILMVGNSLGWTYVDQKYGVSVNMTIDSVNGDQATAFYASSDGGGGPMSLTRQP